MEVHEYDPPATQAILSDVFWEIVVWGEPEPPGVDEGFVGVRWHPNDALGILTPDGLEDPNG